MDVSQRHAASFFLVSMKFPAKESVVAQLPISRLTWTWLKLSTTLRFKLCRRAATIFKCMYDLRMPPYEIFAAGHPNDFFDAIVDSLRRAHRWDQATFREADLPDGMRRPVSFALRFERVNRWEHIASRRRPAF